MPVTEAPTRLDRLALYVEAGTGLQFAGARRRDLHSALRRMAAFKGFDSATACLDWFLGSGWNQEKADLCAVHLTVGETYFFREPRGFELLAQYARNKLRASSDARLRLWSAGCCTGEEPYSMAMMLGQAVPALDPARLAILGTDLNQANLAVARTGLYREWSFRRTDPALRAAHFEATGDGRFALRPEIRAQVRFAQLNLALPVYPSGATAGTDIIFCRNVLMYFSRRQAALAIARMRECLVDGGWLVVNPSEASADLFTGFTGVYHPDAIFFQKSEDPLARPAPAPPPQAERPIAARPSAPPLGSTPPLVARLPGARPIAAPAAPQHLALRAAGAADPTDAALGEWVLRRACEQGRAWQQAGLRAVPVSVNLSARQFTEQIPATVRRILDETGLDPRLLELELTESASMNDPKKSFEILRQLKDMGVRLSIDDFGTGYSNLNYLKRFPVDKLKIDQSFVRDLVSDPDDLAIARAVIAMAHGLRLTVVAEGVETPGQLALLAEHGCDEMQGFFFSPPVDADACALMLREERSLPLASLLRQPYRRTLLYVDDEVNLLSAIRRSLRHKGYHVIGAASAAEAFEILARTEVGVVLCDQRMPGMSGTEFLSRVKYMYPEVMRMVLSGYTDLQSVTDAVNHGAIFKFLTKPWIDEELESALRDAFAEFEGNRPMGRA